MTRAGGSAVILGLSGIVMTIALRNANLCGNRRFRVTKAQAVRQTLNFRVKTEDRNLIDRAARLLGKSRTDFMLDSARQAAQDAVLDQTLFKVKPKVYAQFLARLDAPPRPSKRLRRMLTAKAPWDE
jgi:uncharacterized protein (DUF1778 family)